MKKYYFAASTLMSLTILGTTYAAHVQSINDIATSDPHPQINWTGFYGGINGGFVFNKVTLKSQHLGFTDPSNSCNSKENYSSFFPGLQVGYVRQIDNHIVVGIEGNVTFNTRQSIALNCDCHTNSVVFDQFTLKEHKQASLIGRVGYALEKYNYNLLPFITAGISYVDLGLNYQNEQGDFYSKNHYTAGFRAGGGIEWAFHQHWSVRAEYYYANYGRAIQMNIPVVYQLIDLNGNARLNLTANYVEVALNYWG